MTIKIGLFGSCQLHLCSSFFNDYVCIDNNIKIVFSIASYKYDKYYYEYNESIDLSIFNELDI